MPTCHPGHPMFTRVRPTSPSSFAPARGSAFAHRAAAPAAALVALAIGATLGLAACNLDSPSAELFGQASQRINDGDLEPGQPGVVIVFHQSGSMCTGTLLGRRVVLTAKHCVMREDGTMLSVWGFQIGVGPDMWSVSHGYGVVDVRTTQGASIEDTDVAVLLLDQDAQEQPYRYVLEMPFDLTGMEALLIGYGVDHCPGTNSGTKRRTVDPVIGWYSQNDFVTQGRGANQGDSGGPAFDPDTMAVMGVISRGSYDVCDGYTVVASVAPWKDLINQALTDTGDCAPTSTTDICGDGLDNDCNGIPDDGCAPTGTACEDDMDCASRFCRDVGSGPICTVPCEPGAQDDCPAGSVCLLLDCQEGACAAGAPGSKQVGEPCQGPMECEDLMCRDPGLGHSICMAPCAPDLGQCLATEACLSISGDDSCGGCAPDDLADGPRHLGERCATSTDCASGSCLDDGGLSYCTQTCDNDQLLCPGGFHCREGRCVRGHLGLLADPCLGDEDCESHLSCYGFDSATAAPGYCTATCAGGQGCPPGSTCEGTACVVTAAPQGSACEAAADCLSQGCFSFGGKSSCTAMCDRREPCPPLLACVVADNEMTLCQPNKEPLNEGPPDPVTQPKPKDRCSTGSGGGLGLVLLLSLLLVWRRRRCKRW